LFYNWCWGHLSARTTLRSTGRAARSVLWVRRLHHVRARLHHVRAKLHHVRARLHHVRATCLWRDFTHFSQTDHCLHWLCSVSELLFSMSKLVVAQGSPHFMGHFYPCRGLYSLTGSRVLQSSRCRKVRSVRLPAGQSGLIQLRSVRLLLISFLTVENRKNIKQIFTLWTGSFFFDEFSILFYLGYCFWFSFVFVFVRTFGCTRSYIELYNAAGLH